MFEDMINKLKHEFGYLNEGEADVNKEVNNIEDQVIGQLDRSAKLDEVDTVTFGLETDDGKIVKVYVNAEQADDFEKALAEKLGEIDDIEEVLNELSKDFEIIDVEWPDEKAEEEGEVPEDGQPETDGSEVMNQKVWGKKKEAEVTEGLDFGDEFAMSLVEAAEGNTIESRLTTATQLLIYHAILELGVPEISLNKSPYKSSIVTAIKERATDMQKDPEVKTALKMFVQRAIDGTGGGAFKGADSKPDGVTKMDEPKKKEDSKEEPKRDETKIETTDGEKKEKKDVKEALALVESLTSEFWSGLDTILSYVGSTDDLAKLKNSQKFKSLVSRSGTAIPRVVKTELRMRMNRLATEIRKLGPEGLVVESVSANEVSKLLSELFELVDPTPNKDLARAVINSTEYKAFMLAARPKLSQKFKGASTQKFRDLMASTAEAAALATPSKVVPSKVETIPGTGMTESSKKHLSSMVDATKKEEPVVEAPQVVTEAAEWAYDVDDQDNAVVTFENLKFALTSEELEKAVKAVNSKSTVVLVDAEDPKRKVTFSPRGVNLVIKQVGNSKTYQMSPDQIKEFMEFAIEAAEGKKPEEKEEDEAK